MNKYSNILHNQQKIRFVFIQISGFIHINPLNVIKERKKCWISGNVFDSCKASAYSRLQISLKMYQSLEDVIFRDDENDMLKPDLTKLAPVRRNN